jgi:hypothetical protein
MGGVVGDGRAARELPAHRGHLQDSFFVVGEGLFSDRGTEPAAAAAAASAAADGAQARPFRFRRIGPKGTSPPKPVRVAVAKAMTRPGGGQTGVPAGYTYLGQFIDHDLTFDKSDLGGNVAPVDLLQGRSPALDLDSLYGKGPANPGSAKY